MRNILLAVGAIAALGFASMTACTTDTDTSETGGGGAGTGGAPVGGNTGGTPAGGAGGGASCATCGDWVSAALAGDPAFIEDTCGYQTADDSCDAGSSCELLAELGNCICGGDMPDPANPVCEDVCVAQCTDVGMDTEPDCTDCGTAVIGTTCVDAFNACTLN
jgi:hypothetical protein